MDVLARESAELVAAQAKSRVPVNTGRLQAAIHVDKQGIANYAVVAGDSSAFYGHIVEHGGVHHGAHPFLVPSLEESRGEIVKTARTALRSL